MTEKGERNRVKGRKRRSNVFIIGVSKEIIGAKRIEIVNSKSVLSQVTGLTPVDKGSVHLQMLTPKQSTNISQTSEFKDKENIPLGNQAKI